MIEKWYTCLDARRHRDLIDSHQQQLRQAQLQLEISHARQEIRVRPLLLDVLQIRLNDPQRRKTIQTLAHLARQHTWLERLVINHYATPEQRFVSAEPANQLDRCALSASGFKCGSRKIRERAPQRTRQTLCMSPEVFIDPEVPHVVVVAAEDLIGTFADLHHDRSRVARQL